MRLGIIGGSSLVTFDPEGSFTAIGLSITDQSDIVAKTSYGNVQMRKFELAGNGVTHTIIFMQRHSHGDSGGVASGITPPHAINYKANMKALADQNLDAILATSSVGTILACYPPGRVGVCRQYIDFSGAATTYHDDDAKFTSVTQPFASKINAQLLKTLREKQKLDDDVKLEFTTWLATGPQYETEAEITAIERLGGEVVGMTAPREAKLAAELGVPFSCLTIASNWAAGRHPGDPNMKLNHAEVSETSKKTTGTIVACIMDLLDTAKSNDEKK